MEDKNEYQEEKIKDNKKINLEEIKETLKKKK